MAGRPPKPGRREPSGRLSRTERDLGSPELRRRRIDAHGDPDVGTTSPVDILAVQGLLATPEERRDAPEGDVQVINRRRKHVADRFFAVYAATYGTPHPAIPAIYGCDPLWTDSDHTRITDTMTGEEWGILACLLLRRMIAALEAAGPVATRAVLVHVVHLDPLPVSPCARAAAVSRHLISQ